MLKREPETSVDLRGEPIEHDRPPTDVAGDEADVALPLRPNAGEPFADMPSRRLGRRSVLKGSAS